MKSNATSMLVLMLFGGAPATVAQPKEKLSDEAQANNPLADITAFNVQNYYIQSLSELDDQNANTFWLRYAQPFPLGKGLYFRGAPLWVYDLETNNYRIPIGLGIGKVMPRGNTVFNFFFEPQFTILDRGPGQPERQFYMALNMQFKGKE